MPHMIFRPSSERTATCDPGRQCRLTRSAGECADTARAHVSQASVAAARVLHGPLGGLRTRGVGELLGELLA